MKFILLFILCISSNRLYEREELDIEDQTEIIENEIKAMKNHPDLFESVNVFYRNCLINVVPFLD